MNRSGRRRDLIITTVVFVALTAAGYAWALNTSFIPVQAGREARIVGDAFDLLVYLSVPVLAFVIAVLGYSVVRFRARGEPADAEPVRTHRPFVWSWLVITAALAIFSIFNPGFKGLEELSAEPEADLNINVIAEQWNWTFEYQELGITLEKADELVLPVDTRVAFHITSVDVLHSFWIPALGIKRDAVPGEINTLFATTEVVGNFEDDPHFRVQCAEMCGTGHARMRASARIVEAGEFEEWVAGMGGNA